MSAIVKPMIHTTTALTNPSEMVNIERCASISKVDTPSGPGSSKERFEIHFVLAVDPRTGVPGTVVWSYATAVARNTDYTDIIAAASTAV
jgi:hypothetical protein